MRRFSASWILAICLPLAACAPPSLGHAPAANPQHAEVVAAAQSLFDAMLSRDTTALRAILHPELRITSIRAGNGEPQVRVSTVDEFVTSIARSRALVERMWDPRVEIDGDLASLWAPYDLYRGDQFSHCGHDAFHFARIRGRWVIVGLAYTVQPTGCPPAPRR